MILDKWLILSCVTSVVVCLVMNFDDNSDKTCWSWLLWYMCGNNVGNTLGNYCCDDLGNDFENACGNAMSDDFGNDCWKRILALFVVMILVIVLVILFDKDLGNIFCVTCVVMIWVIIVLQWFR